jgi:hypothetical protein
MIPNEVKIEWMRLQEKYPELRAWTLKEDRRTTRRLGRCRWEPSGHYEDSPTGPKFVREWIPGTITISTWLWKWNSTNHPQLIDTLRHEAAHALAGPRAGHGPVWKAMASTLGADPKSCVTLSHVGLQNHTTFKAVCVRCGKVYLSPVRRRNRVCVCLRENNVPRNEWQAARLRFTEVKNESELLV